MTLYQGWLESIAACQEVGTYDFASLASEDLKAVAIYLTLKKEVLWQESGSS